MKPIGSRVGCCLFTFLLVAGLLFGVARLIEDWMQQPSLPQPTLETLAPARAAMEASARTVLNGMAARRRGGGGYEVPPHLCDPPPILIDRDERGNVFFEIGANVFASTGYFYCSQGVLPDRPPTERDFANIEHLDGPWYAYWSH